MKVFKISYKDNWCVTEVFENILDLAPTGDDMSVGESFKVECIDMSQEELDSLNEFDGWD